MPVIPALWRKKLEDLGHASHGTSMTSPGPQGGAVHRYLGTRPLHSSRQLRGELLWVFAAAVGTLMVAGELMPAPGGAADSCPDHPDAFPVPACLAPLHLPPHHVDPDSLASLSSLATVQTPPNTTCLDAPPPTQYILKGKRSHTSLALEL